MFGLETVENFTFFHYLFLLSGPMCLYFGSLLLLPEPNDAGEVDMPAHLGHVRQKFFLFEAAFWLWAILINPVAFGSWGPAWPFWAVMVVISINEYQVEFLIQGCEIKTKRISAQVDNIVYLF